jgi:hypothetical protein
MSVDKAAPLAYQKSMGEHEKDKRETISTRVLPGTKEKLEKMAKRYRVSFAEVMRWILEDAAYGKYKPSHL